MPVVVFELVRLRLVVSIRSVLVFPRVVDGPRRSRPADPVRGCQTSVPVFAGLKPPTGPRRHDRMMGADELLRHDAHLLRQFDPAHRPRVHDDRGGHPRPPPPPAGRGDLLPDGDGRARLQHPASGRGGGARPAGVRRSERGRVPGDDGARERVERLLRPHDRRAAQGAACRSSSSGSTTAATSSRASTQGSTAPAARPSTPRTSSSTGSARSTGSGRSSSRRRTTSSDSRPTRSRSFASTTSSPDIVLPRFRYNEARSFIERGLDDISVSRASQRWGVPVPWDPDQVVYVWVDALINYWSALAFARPGEDLRPRLLAGGAAPPGEGHPQVPLRHLAGAACSGRASRSRSSCSSTATC